MSTDVGRLKLQRLRCLPHQPVAAPPLALTSPALLSRPPPPHHTRSGGRTAKRLLLSLVVSVVLFPSPQSVLKAPSLPVWVGGGGRERGGWGSEGQRRSLASLPRKPHPPVPRRGAFQLL